MSPRVCAVVPSYNRGRLLSISVEAILAQTRPVDEVLVVDNASTDRACDRIADCFPKASVLQLDRNLGSAGGFCEGAMWAYRRGYDWVWFVDDDSRVAPDCLEALLAAAGRQPRSAFGPLRLWDDDQTFAGLPAWRWDMRSLFVGPEAARTPLSAKYPAPADLPPIAEAEDLAWEGMLVPRFAFDEIGFPSAGYFTQSDDTDFCFRLRRAGYRLWMVSPARIYRLLRPAPRLAPWKVRYWVRNRIWINRLYGETWSARVLRSWLWAARYFLPGVAKCRFLHDREFFLAMYRAVREGLFAMTPQPAPNPYRAR